MKNYRKIITSMVLLVMVVSAVPMGVLGEENETNESWSSELYSFTYNQKIDPWLVDKYTEWESSPEPNILTVDPGDPTSIILDVADGTNISELQVVSGLEIRSVVGDIITANIPTTSLNALADLSCVDYIHGSKPVKLCLDASISEVGADDVWSTIRVGGNPVTGSGTVIGIIDTGIDFTHEDFWYWDGAVKRSRIFNIWDQTQNTGSAPGGYGYGSEYSQTEINNDLNSPIPHSIVTQRDYDGHGTHVTGIAAGDGSAWTGTGTRSGVAPNANIMMVKIDITGISDNADVIDGMNYLVNKAKTIEKPIVISMSLQSLELSAHDGTDPWEKAIDILADEGVIFTVAAGNSRQHCLHASGDVTPGSAEFDILLTRGDFNINQEVTQQIWFDGGDSMSLTLTSPPDQNTNNPISHGPYTGSGSYYHGYFMWDESSISYIFVKNLITITRIDNNPLNGDDAFYVTITGKPYTGATKYIGEPTPNFNPDLVPWGPIHLNQNGKGVWTMQMNKINTVHGRFDSWMLASGGVVTEYTTGLDQSVTITTPATAQRAIAVSSYKTKLTDGTIITGGSISEFSSLGPTRDGRNKPEVSAPGEVIWSVKTNDNDEPTKESGTDDYINMSGTSMAAPHVAGQIALMLQVNPLLTPEEIMVEIEENSRKDSVTGSALWNEKFGYGKLNSPPMVRGPWSYVKNNDAITTSVTCPITNYAPDSGYGGWTNMRVTNSDAKSWQSAGDPNIANTRDYLWSQTSIVPSITPYPSGCSVGASATIELKGGAGPVQLPAGTTTWRVNFAHIHLKTGDTLKFMYYVPTIPAWKIFNQYTGPLDLSTTNSFEIPNSVTYADIKISFYSYNSNPQSPFSITSYEWRNNNMYYPEGMDQTWALGRDYADGIKILFSQVSLAAGDQIIVSDKDGVVTTYTGPISLGNHYVEAARDKVWIRMTTNYDGNRAWGFDIAELQYLDYKWTNWMSWTNSITSWDLTNSAYGGTASDGTKTVRLQARDSDGNIRMTGDSIILARPAITSTTHLVSGIWSTNNNPSFSFYMGALAPQVSKYYYVFDHNPSTVPNPATSSSTMSSTITFPSTADGIWYMHTLAQCQDGSTYSLGHYCVKIDTQYPGPAPVIYSATAGIYDVALSWTSSSDISPLTYLVYKNNALCGITSGTSITITDLSPGTTYSFFVRARDSVNHDIDSTSISRTTFAAPPSPTCFVAGTTISTPDDALPIEEITAEMNIISYNEDTGIKEIKSVTSTSQHEVFSYMQINDLGVTPNHYLYTNNGPVSANMIEVGNQLLCIDGSLIPVVSVETITLAEPVLVYNIEVADNHNYYANGILVHNKVWPPSCPYLWAWNGTDYVSDNSLLANSENLGMPSESVTDYYVTQIPSVPEGEQYMFKILEGELYETSYLDQIKMMTVDHDEEFNVGVAQNGEIYTYENLIPPYECVAKDGTNVTDLVDENDELFFDGHAGDTITMEFTYDDTKPVKLLVRADLKCSTPPPTPENIPSPLYGPININILQENGEWLKVGAIVPRERWSTDIINITPYLPDNANILSILLTWESHHKLDFVNLDQSEDGEFICQEYELSSATHSINGDVLAELNVSNEQYQMLTFGDYVDFTFPFIPSQAQYRDIVMYVKGFYIYNPSFQEITGIDVFQDIEVTANFNGTAESMLDIYFIETAANASRISDDYISLSSLGNEPSYQSMNVMDIIGENSKLLFRYYASEPSTNYLTLTFGIADQEFTLNRTFICDGESLQEGTIDLDQIFSDLYNTSTELFISPYTIGEALIAPDMLIWDFGNGNIVTTTDLEPMPFSFIEPGEYSVLLTVQYPNNRETVLQKVFTIPNRPPIAVIEVYQVVDITLMIAGRKGNTATLCIYEDGLLIQQASVTRQPSDPKAQTTTLILQKYLVREYQLILIYDASYSGENPVWVMFDSGDCTLWYSSVFSTDNGFHQECVINNHYLADIIQNNNEYYFDATGSYDLDGQIESHEWDFGDNVTAIGVLTSHIFAYPGEYLVNLRITDNNGGISIKDFLLEVG